MFADYEENFGLLSHVLEIFDRACKDLNQSEKAECFNLSIAKASQYYGIAKTRQLYQRAFELL